MSERGTSLYTRRTRQVGSEYTCECGDTRKRREYPEACGEEHKLLLFCYQDGPDIERPTFLEHIDESEAALAAPDYGGIAIGHRHPNSMTSGCAGTNLRQNEEEIRSKAQDALESERRHLTSFNRARNKAMSGV